MAGRVWMWVVTLCVFIKILHFSTAQTNQTKCPVGLYGPPNCTDTCGSCFNLHDCNKVTGACPSCKTGFSGTQCKECSPLRWGTSCSPCGTGCAGACHASYGTCTCRDGWAAPYCTECAVGRYGPNCTETCGSCANLRDCNNVTGSCPSCTTGFNGTLCKDCAMGNWGDTCTHLCGSGCEDGVCDALHGICDCKKGWKIPTCEDCTEGHYNVSNDCQNTCGRGCNNTCSRTDGTCLCRPGWQPPLCQTPVTHSPDTWKYQCEINENVTDILWILQSTNETETLSRCSVESESCDQRLEDLARATINSTSSFLYISDSFVGQKEGRVGYAEIINGLRGEIRFDARTNPMNRANGPLTETTEQTDASTDSPAGTDSLAAWQYQCQIRENVTDVLWILQVGNETETLSRCYIGSQSCDQRLDECAMATINRTSSLFNISANLEKEKAGRVGYAEIINGLNGEIRFDAKRNPIKWPCGPLTVTTGMFPSTKQTSDSTDYSTDYSTGRTSP